MDLALLVVGSVRGVSDGVEAAADAVAAAHAVAVLFAAGRVAAAAPAGAVG